MQQPRSWLLVAAVGVLLSCGDGVAPDPVLEFSSTSFHLSDGGFTTLQLTNVGREPVGPIRLTAGPVTGPDAVQVPNTELAVTPAEIARMSPGEASEISIVLTGIENLVAGEYTSVISARLGETVAATVTARYQSVPVSAVASVTLVQAPGQVVQGDVHQLSAEARDASGVVLSVELDWRVDPADAGFVTSEGRLVAFEPGDVRVIASAGTKADTAIVSVSARGLSGAFAVVGHGAVTDRFTSDLWLSGNAAYTGTWGTRTVPDAGANIGNTLYAWDTTDPTNPVLTDSIRVNAGTVNDVKVRAAGDLAVITHEGSSDGLNGVTLLDLSDPHHPGAIGRFTDQLTPGVHNVWIEGNHVYVALDGSGNGLRVLDVTTPASPVVVSDYYAGSSFLHDVYVRDGLAFLAHWNAGLVILDVGGGGRGGAPSAPIELGRVRTAGGQTHNAWYWPARKLVFVGEEDFSTPGVMHVVDVSDLARPVEVATFAVPGTTPHNFWLDEANAVLYLAWYSAGIVALDVSGELLGPLDRQGRLIARCQYGGSGTCPGGPGSTSTWAPQLHDGHIWVSDMNTGLWSLRLDRP